MTLEVPQGVDEEAPLHPLEVVRVGEPAEDRGQEQDDLDQRGRGDQEPGQGEGAEGAQDDEPAPPQGDVLVLHRQEQAAPPEFPDKITALVGAGYALPSCPDAAVGWMPFRGECGEMQLHFRPLAAEEVRTRAAGADPSRR